MKREAVLFYKSFDEAISLLPDEDQLETYRAIIRYGLYGEEPDIDGVAGAIFLLAKPQIDANNRKYENGLRGGRPRKSEEEADKNQDETKEKPIENQDETKEKPKEKDKVKDKGKDKVEKKTELEKALDDFIKHRKKIKSPMTDRAYELFINRLDKLSGGDDQKKIAIINQSIENGWKGVFELKENKFNNANTRKYDMDELELKLLQTN